MTIYDRVLQIMRESEEARNSDKILMWEVWQDDLTNAYEEIGTTNYSVLDATHFMRWCTTPETITRARRKVQQHHPELRAREEVEKTREEKEKSGGNFIFREQ